MASSCSTIPSAPTRLKKSRSRRSTSRVNHTISTIPPRRSTHAALPSQGSGSFSKNIKSPRSSADTIHGHESVWRSTIPNTSCMAWSRTAGSTCCSAQACAWPSRRSTALAISTAAASAPAVAASSTVAGIVVVATINAAVVVAVSRVISSTDGSAVGSTHAAVDVFDHSGQPLRPNV